MNWVEALPPCCPMVSHYHLIPLAKELHNVHQVPSISDPWWVHQEPVLSNPSQDSINFSVRRFAWWNSLRLWWIALLARRTI